MTASPAQNEAFAAIRAAARERFTLLGMPTRQHEQWRFTDLTRFGAHASGAAGEVVLPAPLLPGSPRYVFVDGVFDAGRSTVLPLPAGASADNIRHAQAGSLLGRQVTADTHAVEALNTAAFQDGFVLTVGPGTDLPQPIEVMYVGTGSVQSHARLLVELGANSSATIIERHAGVSTYAGTLIGEIHLGDGTKLHHYRQQNTSPEAMLLQHNFVQIEQDATYHSFALTTGAALSRHQISVTLTAPGGEVHLNGVHVLGGDMHADTTTFIDHAAPHCSSRETYRQVLDGHSRGVFQGKILVRPHAQKTDGFQLNQALMLSDTAEVNAKPELEIYADDVKCSHGATSGRLDAEALFYLRSRGIPEVEAKQMLVQAFIGATLDLIDNEAVRAAFGALI